MSRLEARLRLVEMDQLMEFYFPEKFLPYCRECPNYNARWSCPPYDKPLPRLEEYAGACLLSVQAVYDEETRAQTKGAQATEAVYRRVVGQAKRLLWPAAAAGGARAAPGRTACLADFRKNSGFLWKPWGLT